jgi:hypothetical protein
LLGNLAQRPQGIAPEMEDSFRSAFTPLHTIEAIELASDEVALARKGHLQGSRLF